MKLVRSIVLPAVACASLATASIANAGVTSKLDVESYRDFDAGDAKSAFITSIGEVRPGFATDKLDLEFHTSWSAIQGKDGTVYIGSSKQGTVHAVRSGKVSKLAVIPDVMAVVSLAIDSRGDLYAGTMPAGQVWKINARTGKATKYATLKDAETVWTLAMTKGALYAGTGPNGVLWKIVGGKATKVFETDDKRVMASAVAKDGSVWFGTSDKALLYRHDPKSNRTRAMADFAGNEVTAIAAVGDGVVAAANDLKEPSTGALKTKSAIDKAKGKTNGGQKPKAPGAKTKPGADAPTRSGTEPIRKGARKGKGALWRVSGDGQMTQVHSLTATYFTSLASNSKGDVYAGAGDKGRVYLIGADEAVSTVFDVEQRMIGQIMINSADRVSFTTGDSSWLYRGGARAKTATYESKVFDTKNPSRFGKIVWHGEGQLAVETRTGNTSKPGKGWSAWQKPGTAVRSGGGATRGKIASPVGRYVQFRVKLGGTADTVLRKARIYYLPQNRATKLESVTVATGGSSGNKLVTMTRGASKPRSPIMKVSWKVENPDQDDTVYELSVRREGDARWRKIVTGSEPLTSTSHSWNTEMFPDGYYRLRVVATDARANSADRARHSTKTTGLFLVDNNKPVIDSVAVRYPVATARATDAMSAISEMSFSIDDGPWSVGATRDGLFDDQSEMLSVALPKGLSPGVHTLAIRVADEAGNVGSTSITFQVRR